MSEIPYNDIKNIHPLNRLSDPALKRLSQGMCVLQLSANERLFSLGDSPDCLYYVLDGRIDLHNEKNELCESVTREPGLEVPLPYTVPTAHTGLAFRSARVLAINRKLLDAILFMDQPDNAQAIEQSYSMGSLTGDWTKAFFRARGFKRVPSKHIQEAFSRSQILALRKGDVFINKGDAADCVYVVARGTVHVMNGNAKLAEYGMGATVGEDGLISGKPRNASVMMATDGEVAKLGVADFNQLIRPYLLSSVTYENSKMILERGGRWLDVRLHSEVGGARIKDSIHVAYPIVRSRLFTADPTRPYIVVCATGRDSQVITFMLNKYGFDAFYLEGGFGVIPASEYDSAG